MKTMFRPHGSANDPFEHIVELTAAALTRRPPAEEVYQPVALTLSDRVSGFLDRVLMPEGAANDPEALEYERLHRYYY